MKRHKQYTLEEELCRTTTKTGRVTSWRSYAYDLFRFLDLFLCQIQSNKDKSLKEMCADVIVKHKLVDLETQQFQSLVIPTHKQLPTDLLDWTRQHCGVLYVSYFQKSYKKSIEFAAVLGAFEGLEDAKASCVNFARLPIIQQRQSNTSNSQLEFSADTVVWKQRCEGVLYFEFGDRYWTFVVERHRNPFMIDSQTS